MKGDPRAIAALNDCLKYERTLQDLFRAYHEYFCRWRIHRLEEWFEWNHEAAEKRAACLALRILALDAVPGQDRFGSSTVPVETAADIDAVFRDLVDVVRQARDAYERQAGKCKDADDSVSASLLGHHQREIEDTLGRLEAKRNKVRLIGAAAYIAHHMHELG